MADDRYALLQHRLDDRVRELRESGPGEVRCLRIHTIADVSTLRACHEALTTEQRAWVASQRARCEDALFGLQLSGPSNVSRRHRSTAEPDHWIHQVYFGILDPLGSLWSAFRSRRVSAPGTSSARLVEMTERAALPVPTDLLDAAEAWLLAGLSEGRVLRSLSPLKVPWETAEVVPLDGWERP